MVPPRFLLRASLPAAGLGRPVPLAKSRFGMPDSAMLTGSYRKRLEADLVRWVGEGLLSADSAAAIRRSLAKEGGFRLPALLGMFGGLLIASSVAAFVAANWEEIPRVAKLIMIACGIVAALGISARLERRGSRSGADSASTCGVLVFAAGVALVGQMYHLPTDWAGGALLIAIGALAVALLQRSNGALAIALVAICAWTAGRWDETRGALQPGFFVLYLPAVWLALSSSKRAIHHLTVLALGLWLSLLPGYWFGPSYSFDFGLLAYALAVSVVYVALGALAIDRGGPALVTACLPWGLMGMVVILCVELVRILDDELGQAGHAIRLNYVAYAFAIAALGTVLGVARDKRFAWPLSAALLLSLLVPLVFWSGTGVALLGKVFAASLILLAAIALVVAGAGGGMRRLTTAGAALFGITVLILLWQTVGTLLHQSLFFLVAGAVLLALASAARRLFARLHRPAGGEAA
jgi:uncharacterized membrane protein